MEKYGHIYHTAMNNFGEKVSFIGEYPIIETGWIVRE